MNQLRVSEFMLMRHLNVGRPPTGLPFQSRSDGVLSEVADAVDEVAHNVEWSHVEPNAVTFWVGRPVGDTVGHVLALAEGRLGLPYVMEARRATPVDAAYATMARVP